MRRRAIRVDRVHVRVANKLNHRCASQTTSDT
jgi:hypothetical protein